MIPKRSLYIYAQGVDIQKLRGVVTWHVIMYDIFSCVRHFAGVLREQGQTPGPAEGASGEGPGVSCATPAEEGRARAAKKAEVACASGGGLSGM